MVYKKNLKKIEPIMGNKDGETTTNVIEGSVGIRGGENDTEENLLNMFIQEGSSKPAVATW